MQYPFVPGHELVGPVSAIGSNDFADETGSGAISVAVKPPGAQSRSQLATEEGETFPAIWSPSASTIPPSRLARMALDPGMRFKNSSGPVNSSCVIS
jgi:hypothetical protein